MPDPPLDVHVGAQRGEQDTCTFCHDDLGTGEERGVPCPACGVALHLECWQETNRCPSQGCQGVPSLLSNRCPVCFLLGTREGICARCRADLGANWHLHPYATWPERLWDDEAGKLRPLAVVLIVLGALGFLAALGTLIAALVVLLSR